MPAIWSLLAALVMAALLSVSLTPVIAVLARRGAVVAAPRLDRWGGRPTPLLGGVAIVTAIVGGVPVLGRIDDLDRIARNEHADLVIVAIDDEEGRARVRSRCDQLGLESREFSRAF